MRAAYKNSVLLSLTTIAILAGCSGRREQVAIAPPPPATPAVMPTPPMGATPNMTPPPLGADGRRVTPNRNLSAVATLWHVRMALNVAALSCRDSADAARLQYNAFLKSHKTTLAKVNSAVDTEFKGRFGGQAFAAREKLNTAVYNFFALPPVQRAFCERAIMVGGAIGSMSAADLQAYAPSALASMEQPFTDFYDAYAVYQSKLAQWRGNAPGQTLSMMTPVTPALPAPVDLAQGLSRSDMLGGDEVVALHAGRSRVFAGR
jgi:hypothetical protein